MADNKLRISEVPAGLVVAGAVETVVTKASGFVASEAAGERGMGRYTGSRLTPTYEEIAQLAHFFYELRGRQDGHDTEDWLRAEQQLVHHYA